MPNMTQYQASKAVSAKLRKQVGELPVGTEVELTYIRSYLSRPRYLGGRLQHDYDLSLAGVRMRVTDKDLEDLVFVGNQGRVTSL